MKRNLLIRLALLLIKFPAIIMVVIFITLPCLFIGEENFGYDLAESIMDFGIYKRGERK